MARQSKKDPYASRILAAISSLTVILIIILIGRPEAITAAIGLADATPTPVTLGQLRQIAESRGIRVGVTDAGFGTRLYENTIPQEFNSITSENYMKFENIHPCPPVWLINSNSSVSNWVVEHGLDNPDSNLHCTVGQADQDEWNWGYADQRVEWAAEHGLGFRGHTLVWAMQNPGWLQLPLEQLSVEERQQVMVDHIRQVIEHYCPSENIYAYDVVNEALGANGNLVESVWSPIPGYVDLAFRTARDALDACGREDVKLYYNETGFEYANPKADYVYEFLSQMVQGEDPTPIDGVGFQTHTQQLYASTPSHDIDALVTTMNRFSSGLGLEVAITETDLPIHATPRAEWYEQQADWYWGRMQACLLAIRCTGFTTWGTHDGESWRNVDDADYDPLMFQDAGELIYDGALEQCVTPAAGADDYYCPKPAYGAVYDALVAGVTKSSLPIVLKGGAGGDGFEGSPVPYPPPADDDSPWGVPYPAPGKP